MKTSASSLPLNLVAAEVTRRTSCSAFSRAWLLSRVPRVTLRLAGLLAAAILLVSGCPVIAADAPKSWSGTWNNRKYNTSGALTCTVVGEQDGKWIAKFTGVALGKPISYTALMTPKQNGANTTLSGTTKVDGFDYQWSAAITGKALNGTYRASNGNNGEFRLQAKQ